MKLRSKWMIGAALVLVPEALLAQWPPYPTPGVPRTADGRPNLEGPAPRTPGGKPDFSGIWRFVDSPDARPGPAPPAGVGTIGIGQRAPGLYQFFDIGSTLPGGLPFQPWAAELRRQRAAANNKDNPDAHCLPLGPMQLHTHPEPRKIIQTPNLLVILYEANGGIRQIFTDGRPLPSDDAQPWWYGYSTGQWNGDTLVVRSSGFRDDVWLDVEGSPMTHAARMTERFRRPNFGNMEIEVTVDDPKAYTRPWTVTIHHRLMLDTELIEFICNENEKDVPHMTGH
ncbi:MAG TPA: hypothetical protein VJ732_19745 [Bryobacteraceae bacterium]|nr:hypothetical protein [Bryobacteraceae bacterium]